MLFNASFLLISFLFNLSLIIIILLLLLLYESKIPTVLFVLVKKSLNKKFMERKEQS